VWQRFQRCVSICSLCVIKVYAVYNKFVPNHRMYLISSCPSQLNLLCLRVIFLSCHPSRSSTRIWSLHKDAAALTCIWSYSCWSNKLVKDSTVDCTRITPGAVIGCPPLHCMASVSVSVWPCACACVCSTGANLDGLKAEDKFCVSYTSQLNLILNNYIGGL